MQLQAEATYPQGARMDADTRVCYISRSEHPRTWFGLSSFQTARHRREGHTPHAANKNGQLPLVSVPAPDLRGNHADVSPVELSALQQYIIETVWHRFAGRKVAVIGRTLMQPQHAFIQVLQAAFLDAMDTISDMCLAYEERRKLMVEPPPVTDLARERANPAILVFAMAYCCDQGRQRHVLRVATCLILSKKK